ncbi:MAG TPA: alpha/beta hydrolase [Xanthobacteraceae bacterium]|nr:alpha/beta hydrolase [Xanthobacteraceae bacterium]
MADAFTSSRRLHAARGGEGARLLVLLHGMGANHSVWRPLLPLVAEHWNGRWIAPDFRGHGRSPYEGPYGYGIHAADIAALILQEQASEITLLGHSFGGLVAALLGGGLFGIKVARVAAVGVKIVWTEAEVAKAREVAQRPARAFDTREEAIERYLKISGLFGLIDPSAPEALIGVREQGEKFFVAFDPRAAGGVGPSVETLLRLCTAPLRLAAGAADPMVTLADMQRVDAFASLIEGVGHNAHWEAPERVWRWFADTDARLARA